VNVAALLKSLDISAVYPNAKLGLIRLETELADDGIKRVGADAMDLCPDHFSLVMQTFSLPCIFGSKLVDPAFLGFVGIYKKIDQPILAEIVNDAI
jgi:hypothetical protein